MGHSLTFLTGGLDPSPDDETPVLMDALAGLGITARMARWWEPVPEPGDLTVIRSTWDYAAELARFLAALAAIPAPVLNPIDVVQWNSHKGYLVELALAGVPVVPTTLVRPGEAPGWPAGAAVVVKPAVSAGAVGTERFDAGDPAAVAHLEFLLTSGDALIQPFLTEVADGEMSLIYIDGAFSHAVRKYPGDGEYRVQEHLGGSVEPAEPTAAEREVAEQALGQVNGDLLYARVDLVTTATGPQLMELELIEPYLYLLDVPGSVAVLAEAIARRLG